jgi:hypothetical protein
MAEADVAAEDGSRTPKQSDVKGATDSIDPALRGEEAKSPSEPAGTPAAHSETDDKRQEEWVENIRVIEALRRWIGDRLRTGEYDSEDQQEQDQQHHEHSAGEAQAGASAEDESMMETARMVQKLAEANAAHNAAQEQQQQQSQEQNQDVKYPSLP